MRTSITSMRWPFAATLLCCLLLARSVGAQPIDPRAQELFETGKKHFELAEYSIAIAKWKAAYLIANSPLVLFNIAQAYRLSGDCAQANRFYANYQRLVPKPPNPAELEAAMAKCKGVPAATAEATQPIGGGERVAVVAIELAPKLPGYLRAKARSQIEQGLGATDYKVVPGREVEALPAELAGCREGACLAQVGAALKVALLVMVTISAKDDSTLVELRIVDGATGQVLATVSETCDLCGIVELEQRISIAASLLRSRVEELRARREADAEQARRMEEARKVANPVTTYETKRSLSIAGVSVAALGAVATGAGIYLLAIDGRGTCEPGDQPEYPDPGAVIRYPDPGDRSVYVCKNRYDTKLSGTVTLSAGIAAIALGAVLIVRGKTERIVVVSPAEGGATVGVRGTW